MTPAALSRQAAAIYPRYLDVAGLCAYLTLPSDDAVYRLVQQGLPASRLGRGARARYRFDRLRVWYPGGPLRGGRRGAACDSPNTHERTDAMANEVTKDAGVAVTIKPPKFQTAVFPIVGLSPLVIHRFSAKTKAQMKQKMEEGKPSGSRKNREAKSTDAAFEEARYRSAEGWDGFNASAVRNAMISACRLVGFKMTLAKLSLFVEPDGVDAKEPQIPLIRIEGKAAKQEDMARVSTGDPYVTVRAAFYQWKAQIRIRWDSDQFTLQDVTNLLARVGLQVGIGEGRPDSKASAGMGWGLFQIES